MSHIPVHINVCIYSSLLRNKVLDIYSQLYRILQKLFCFLQKLPCIFKTMVIIPVQLVATGRRNRQVVHCQCHNYSCEYSSNTEGIVVYAFPLYSSIQTTTNIPTQRTLLHVLSHSASGRIHTSEFDTQ